MHFYHSIIALPLIFLSLQAVEGPGAEAGGKATRTPESSVSAPGLDVAKACVARQEQNKPSQPPLRRLIGGWRLSQEFARGTLAIDFARMKCWMAGQAAGSDVLEFDLPAMGVGTDVNQWPALKPVKVIGAWWPQFQAGSNTFAAGLAYFRGRLWAAPKVFYNQTIGDLTLYAQDGGKIETKLPRHAFAGFVKRRGQEPLLGGGGVESGQGSVAGPTLATLEGQVLIQYEWPATPGPKLEKWDKRAPRPANYFPVNHQDAWYAWEPRNGEGRWAVDRVYGGGLVLPEGVTYWPRLGLGEISYTHGQPPTTSPTMSKDNASKTYVYRFDPTTYAFKNWEESELGRIVGQEIDEKGRVYLAEWGAWKGGFYQTDVAVKVFE